MIGICLCLHNDPSICAFSNEMSVSESVHKYMCHTGHWTCLYIPCIRLHWHYRTAHQSAVIIIVVLWVPKWKKVAFIYFYDCTETTPYFIYTFNPIQINWCGVSFDILWSISKLKWYGEDLEFSSKVHIYYTAMHSLASI